MDGDQSMLTKPAPHPPECLQPDSSESFNTFSCGCNFHAISKVQIVVKSAESERGGEVLY